MSFLALAQLGFAPPRDDAAESGAATPIAPSPAPATRSTNEPPALEPDPPLPPGDSPRPMPSYDGRAQPTSVGRSLLWVPRVLLFPLYLLSEGIRRPLGAGLSYAEEHHWQARWRDFFTFGPNHQLGIFPTGRIDLGLRPTVGVYFFSTDTFAHSDFRLRVTLSSLDTFNVHSLVRTPLGSTRKLTLAFSFAQRADGDFYGFGPSAPDEPARFYEERIEGKVGLWQELSEISGLTTYVGVRAERFDPDAKSRRSLAEEIESGAMAAPPGLESGVLALYSGVAAYIDTRAPRLTKAPTTVAAFEHRGGSGLVVAGRVEHWSGLERSRAVTAEPGRLPEWIKYGAMAGASADLTGSRRTIDLITTLELADPLPGDNPIPFTELVSLGGNQPLRAFRAGRLLDRSATSATLTYHWPIWVYLDGAVHYAVGNVFGPHLEGFRPELLRSSFGIGIESAGSSEQPFEVLLAFGTAPFEEGAHVESLRFVFGTRSSF